MAIEVTNLTSGGDASASQTYNTASISPAANTLIKASVEIRSFTTTGVITLSGCGLTWVEIASVEFSTIASPQSRLAEFRALGPSPTSGAVTITITGGGTNAACRWCIDRVSGTVTSGTNGSGAIVQYATNSTDSGTSLTATLNALADSANNAVYAAFGNGEGFAAVTPGTGYTETSDGASGNAGLETQYKVPGTTTPSASGYAAFSDIAVIAVEIAAAAAGPSLPVFMNQYRQRRN